MLSLVLLLQWPCVADSPPSKSKWVYITPEWVAQHPGRLKVFGGTAASGLNNYGFQLKTPGTFRWKIVIRLYPKKSRAAAALYETMSRTDGVTNTVEVGYVENQPYAFDVTFHIARVLPESDEESAEREYVIRLADWDRLIDATQRHK
jgi:hypothetical protein